jgi:hypothetical protein
LTIIEGEVELIFGSLEFRAELEEAIIREFFKKYS